MVREVWNNLFFDHYVHYLQGVLTELTTMPLGQRTGVRAHFKVAIAESDERWKRSNCCLIILLEAMLTVGIAVLSPRKWQ